MFGSESISAREVTEIAAEPAEVGVDERRARVLAKDTVLLGHDRRPRRILARRTRALRTLLQLQPALVGLVVRLEELARLRGVDEHGNAQLARLAPHGIEPRIIDRHALARSVLEVEPEILEDLESASARLDILLELSGGVRTPRRIINAGELEIGEECEPAACCALRAAHCVGEGLAGAPAEIHHGAHVERVHLAREARIVGRQRLVTVHVNERVLRARDLVLGNDQR